MQRWTKRCAQSVIAVVLTIAAAWPAQAGWRHRGQAPVVECAPAWTWCGCGLPVNEAGAWWGIPLAAAPAPGGATARLNPRVEGRKQQVGRVDAEEAPGQEAPAEEALAGPVVHDPLTMLAPEADDIPMEEAAPAAAPGIVNIFEAVDALRGAEAADGVVPTPGGIVDAGDEEPLRRWIDASGSRSLVGRLVRADEDGVCVLEVQGREVSIPRATLSGHDRAYVDQVAGLAPAVLPAGEVSPADEF